MTIRSAIGAAATASARSSTCSCPAAAGRPWSKIPVAEGWERVISGNSCPKGLLEDVNEMRIVKARIDEGKRAYPNVAEMVRASRLPPRLSRARSCASAFRAYSTSGPPISSG